MGYLPKYFSLWIQIAILNASSAIGRVLGNYLADLFGPFNVQVPCTLFTGATIFAVLGV
jgi:hypothetical protein